MLVHHDFPGNVCELQNVLEHAFVLCRGGVTEPRPFPTNLQHNAASKAMVPEHRINLKVVEKSLIHEALAKHQGSVSASRLPAATVAGTAPDRGWPQRPPR